MSVRLQVNVDHVATLRQARGTAYPDPVEVAIRCEHAGADGITVHLREDRRHIQDRDVEVLKSMVKTRLNLEMAATTSMLEFAERVRPDVVTLVPERREERTTEGGLDLAGGMSTFRAFRDRLLAAGVEMSVFIAPDPKQLDAALELDPDTVELHTGEYANADDDHVDEELSKLQSAALHLDRESELLIAAGHGLTVRNTPALIAEVPEIEELNIGHAIIADAVIFGIDEALERFREAVDQGVLDR